MAGYSFRRMLNGGECELLISTVGAVAVKTGDAVKVGATQNVVIPITAVKDLVVGVAQHDAAIGAEVSLLQVTAYTVFEAIGVTTAYVEATYRYLNADSGFVSGAMVVNPAVVTTTGDVQMLRLAGNTLSAVIGNHFEVIFLNRKILG